jgi:hypothetical protein
MMSTELVGLAASSLIDPLLHRERPVEALRFDRDEVHPGFVAYERGSRSSPFLVNRDNYRPRR